MTNPFAAVWLVVIGILVGLLLAVAAFGAMGAGHAMDDMWTMMGDMGDMRGMMGGGGGPQTSGSASGTGVVQIADFRFEPTALGVTPGTTVTWTNDDSAPHTATARDDSFDSGKLFGGASASVKFDAPGTYEYFCKFHSAMAGQIIVANR